MDPAKGTSRPLQVPAGQSPEDAVAALNWQMLAAKLDPPSRPLGQNASVSASYDGGRFLLTYALASTPADSPGLSWETTSNGEGEGAVSFVWLSTAYGGAKDPIFHNSFDVNLVYRCGGLITTSGATVQIWVRMSVNVTINLFLAGQDALSTTANILDYTWTVPYQVGGEGPSFTAAIVGETQLNRSQPLDRSILARLALPLDAFMDLRHQGQLIGTNVAPGLAGPLLATLAG